MSRPLSALLASDTGKRVTRTGSRYIGAILHGEESGISLDVTLWRDGRALLEVREGGTSLLTMRVGLDTDGVRSLTLGPCAIPFIDDRADYPRAGLRKSQEEAP